MEWMITQNSYEVTVCFQPLYSHFKKLKSPLLIASLGYRVSQ